MKLIHAGKVLKDDDVIGTCNIKPNDFLVVMIAKVSDSAGCNTVLLFSVNVIGELNLFGYLFSSGQKGASRSHAGSSRSSPTRISTFNDDRHYRAISNGRCTGSF